MSADRSTSLLKPSESFLSFPPVDWCAATNARRFAFPHLFHFARLPRCRDHARKGDSMSVAAQTLRPPSRTLMLLEGRAIHELAAFIGAVPLLRLAPRGDGHPVLVLPGLIASDTSTRPLRAFLNNRNYAAHGWRQGRNFGLR